MKIIGIICEYNPFHLGHKKQIDWLREKFGPDCAIVCLMSGNYVQRGQPAILDKSIRAEAAIVCGADLVLELPVNIALSSAEGFAAGAVRILSGFCDCLCFGSESGNLQELMNTAKALLSPDFPPILQNQLATGVSFPSARQQALESLGINASLLEKPNDILAVEYCKAILSQASTMTPLVMVRQGDYHDILPNAENPSATSLRKLLLNNENWQDFVPQEIAAIYRHAPIYTLEAGQRAILYRLRTMTDEEFEALPYGSEGLWRKLMRNCRSCATLEEILTTTKSKRYTRSRLDRMVLCAFLGLTDLSTHPPYIRVLAFGEKGKAILKLARQTGDFPHVGEQRDGAYAALERRCEDLYGLFCVDAPQPSGTERKRRVIILKSEEGRRDD